MFIGPRLNRVFASRWNAVFWALSILGGVWFEHSNNGKGALEAVAGMAGAGGAGAAQSAPVDPWARSGPADAAAPAGQDAGQSPWATAPQDPATPAGNPWAPGPTGAPTTPASN